MLFTFDKSSFCNIFAKYLTTIPEFKIQNSKFKIKLSHWLEEIERIESRKHRSASDSARIQDKKFRIQQNYAKNKGAYESFLQKLNGLVERVNNLPLEYRELFGKINGKAKSSRLDNHLHYFSSSRRIQRMQFKNFLQPFKNVHFKHIRVIYFNVAKVMDKVEVEILEEFLEKKKHDGKVIPEQESGKRSSGSQNSQDKFHEIYYYDIGKLNEELALATIDWLVFREDVDHLPVVHDGEPRLADH